MLMFCNISKAQKHVLDSANYDIIFKNTLTKERTKENFIFSDGKFISKNHAKLGYEPGNLYFDFDTIDSDSSVNVTFEVELINKKKEKTIYFTGEVNSKNSKSIRGTGKEFMKGKPKASYVYSGTKLRTYEKDPREVPYKKDRKTKAKF